MASIVLRVRLMTGDHLDVTFDEPDTTSDDELLDHAVSALSADPGSLRCQHGDKLILLFARGVAAMEVAPVGPVI